MKKRLFAFFMVTVILFSGFSVTGEVSDLRRTVEGYIEIAVRALRGTFGVREYSDYEELCLIPETENGYVPQGYCYSENFKLHFISYYHETFSSKYLDITSATCAGNFSLFLL